MEEVRAIESQAIARACRIGQKNKVMVIRVLIEKTIEEEIIRASYDKDVQINFKPDDMIINELINVIPKNEPSQKHIEI